jgi:crotonobetainyl-CoA:carnitine CoA-transferase CaiB-like acyl-CoA transferase
LGDLPYELKPAPLLGEHNEEIYCRRLGYSKKDLVRLRETGVI